LATTLNQMERTMKTMVGLALAGALAVGGAGIAAAQDESGTITLSVEEGGIGVGGESGSGTLTYQGEEYPLTISGLSVGLEFGLTRADLSGTVSKLQEVGDVEGIYTQAEAVAVAGEGIDGVVLQNSNGVELQLSGKGQGLEGSLDLGGMELSLKE